MYTSTENNSRWHDAKLALAATLASLVEQTTKVIIKLIGSGLDYEEGSIYWSVRWDHQRQDQKSKRYWEENLWWTVWWKPNKIQFSLSPMGHASLIQAHVVRCRCDNVSTQGWTIVANTTCIQARLHATGRNCGSFDGSVACYITPWFFQTAVIARLPLVSSHRAGTRKATKDRWAATWQNQQSDCAPSEDSDQPGHPPSLISLRCALNGYLRTQAFFMRTAKTLIRLGGCPGWSESSMGAHSFCWFCNVAAQVQEIKSVIKTLTSRTGHSCLQWNETADQLAKEAAEEARIMQKETRIVPIEASHKTSLSGWKTRWTTLQLDATSMNISHHLVINGAFDFPDKVTFQQIIQLQTGYSVLNEQTYDWSESIPTKCTWRHWDYRVFLTPLWTIQ